jgi:hypothetical protein
MRKGIPFSAILSSLLATPLLAAPAIRPQPLGETSAPQSIAVPAAPCNDAAAANELQERLKRVLAGEKLDVYGMQDLHDRMARAMNDHLNQQLILARQLVPVQFSDAAGSHMAIRTEKSAFLGVSTSPASSVLRSQLNLPRGMGLVVDYVEKGSPADSAGIQVHDVLQKLDDQWLVNPQQLAVLVRAKKPGDSIPFTVIRGGKEVQVTTKLAEKDLPVLEDLQEPGVFGNPGMVPLHPFPGINQGIENMQDFNLVPHSSGMSVHVDSDGTSIRTLVDDENDIRLTTHGDQTDLVVKDHDGNVIYSGAADSADLPPNIKAKVDTLKNHASIRIGAPAHATGSSLSRSDDQHQITLHIDKAGRLLIVKDVKTGKELFNGPYATDDDLKNLPADVQAKVKALGEKARLEVKPLREGVDDMTPPAELRNQ